MASGNVFASLLSNKNKNKDTVQDNYKGVMDNITKQRENVLNTPTKESIEADLYSKPSQNWGEAFWQGRGARKKVDDLENGKGGMLNYLMEVGQAATKMNAEYAREQHAKEIAVPLMEKYNKIAPNLTPDQRIDAANQIRARLSEVLGQDLPPVIDTGGSKFENWVTQDPETGNVKYFDLLAELNPNGDKDLNSLERMAIQQQQFNNTLDTQKLLTDKKRVAAYEAKNEFDSDPYKRAQRAALEERAKKNAGYIHDIQQKMVKGDESLESLEEIANVIEKSSLAGSSPIASLKRWWATKTGNTEDIDSVNMMFLDQLKQLKEMYGTNVSNYETQSTQKSWANLEKDPKAALTQIKRQIVAARNKQNLYRQQISAYDADPSVNLYSNKGNVTQEGSITHQDGTSNKPLPNPNRTKNDNTGKEEERVIMYDESGNPMAVKRNKTQTMIDKGFTFIKRAK